MANSFTDALKIGEIGEERALAHFIARGGTVEDVRYNPEYQRADIDFFVTAPNGNRFSLEVKTDNGISRYGNLYFEDSSSRGMGWLHYCQAQYICFYDAPSRHAYVIDFSKAKALLPIQGHFKSHYDYQD